jgi:hypothetical protein
VALEEQTFEHQAMSVALNHKTRQFMLAAKTAKGLLNKNAKTIIFPAFK